MNLRQRYQILTILTLSTRSSDMQPVERTHLLSQLEGELEPNPVIGKWRLTKSYLPCSCYVCRPDDESPAGLHFSFEEFHKTSTADVKMSNDKNAFDPTDLLYLQLLNVEQLKEVLNGRGVYAPSKIIKGDLISLLTDVIQTEMEAEEDDEEEDNA